MAIQVLDAATVSRIAAGEVVERPASIAKELVENALDAGSTSISVEIREGGMELLRVTDNGCGIPARETRVAFENHATSKLQSGGDLTDIRTLGFRGEALASVAAVSKVEMRTRTRGAQSGARIRVEGGVILGIDETGCPEGTAITVRDLFYNVPARKAFLRKPAYEAGAVYDVVTRLILGNPGVSIRLVGNGRVVCHSFGDGKLVSAALSVFGRDVAGKLTEIDVSEGAFCLRGLVGLRDCAKANRSQQYFFINGRTVRCPLLSAALEQASRERVGICMHPICALHVTLPPSSVDVNVHPNKLEVRFRDEAYFRITAESLLLRALQGGDGMLNIDAITKPAKQPPEPIIPEEAPKNALEMTVEEKLQKAREAAEKKSAEAAKEEESFFARLRSPKSSLRESSIPAKRKQTTVEAPSQDAIVTEKPPEIAQKAEPVTAKAATPISDDKAEQIKLESVIVGPTQVENRPKYRIIGVALRTYLLLEANDALILIDQHAAHERILYERYKEKLDLGVASQRLLTPLILSVTPKELALIEENETAIREAGYEIAPFGEREIRVNAVPFVLGTADLRPTLLDMIEELGGLKGAEMQKRMDAIVKLSCRKAIKAGDELTNEQIEALVCDMQESGAPPTCPHGRPVARVLTKGELEKMFWRT